MTQSALIASAQAIPKASDEAIAAFEQHTASIAEKVSAAVQVHPDFDKVVGPANLDLMRDNHRNQSRFFLATLIEPNAETFVNTCLWAIGVYRSRGIQPDYWHIMPKAWIQSIDETLSEKDASEIKPLFEWILKNQTTLLNNAKVDKDQMHGNV